VRGRSLEQEAHGGQQQQQQGDDSGAPKLTGGPLRSRPGSRSCDRSDSHTCKCDRMLYWGVMCVQTVRLS
jgi:hypothetical protein